MQNEDRFGLSPSIFADFLSCDDHRERIGLQRDLLLGKLARGQRPWLERGGVNDREGYFAKSLRAFSGRTLTTFRAGFALNICSCFVKGLIPLWAGTAGF